MATILPGSPPSFNKNDVESTVKALCVYARNLHETLDYTLGQFEKNVNNLRDAIEAQNKLIEQQNRTISTLQTSLASALQIMNEQYTELNTRVSALEAGQT